MLQEDWSPQGLKSSLSKPKKIAVCSTVTGGRVILSLTSLFSTKNLHFYRTSIRCEGVKVCNRSSSLSIIGSLSNDDSDVNENGKKIKAMALDWQNNNFASESHFFVHFFAVIAWLRHENVKFHVFSRMTWTKGNSFFFLFLNFYSSLWEFNSRKNANIWRIERSGISAINFEAGRHYFLSNAFVAVPVVVAWRWCYTGRFATTIFSTTQRCDINCCNILLNGCNIVPTLQRFVAQNIVVANRPVLNYLKLPINSRPPTNKKNDFEKFFWAKIIIF